MRRRLRAPFGLQAAPADRPSCFWTPGRCHRRRHQPTVCDIRPADLRRLSEPAQVSLPRPLTQLLAQHWPDHALPPLSRYQPSLSLAVQSKLIDTLLSALQAEIDQSSRSQLSDDPSSHLAHKEPLERYAFLIQWFIAGAERAATKGEGDVGPAAKKGKGGAKPKKAPAGGRKGDWVWEQAIPGVLKDLGKALKLKTDRIWTTTQERDTFIKCASEPSPPSARASRRP